MDNLLENIERFQLLQDVLLLQNEIQNVKNGYLQNAYENDTLLRLKYPIIEEFSAQHRMPQFLSMQQYFLYRFEEDKCGICWHVFLKEFTKYFA